MTRALSLGFLERSGDGAAPPPASPRPQPVRAGAAAVAAAGHPSPPPPSSLGPAGGTGSDCKSASTHACTRWGHRLLTGATEPARSTKKKMGDRPFSEHLTIPQVFAHAARARTRAQQHGGALGELADLARRGRQSPASGPGHCKKNADKHTRTRTHLQRAARPPHPPHPRTSAPAAMKTPNARPVPSVACPMCRIL